MNPQYNRYYTFVKPIFRNKVVKTYGSFIFSIITITVLGVFAIRPTVSTIVSLQKSIDEEKAILNQLTTKTENLTTGKKNYENLDTSVKSQLFSLLPDSTALPHLINSLNSLSETSQASVSGIQFQPVDLQGPSKKLSKVATVREVDFVVNVQGSYKSLVDFLNGLATGDRLISVKAVNFNKGSEGSLVMSINATAYYFKN